MQAIYHIFLPIITGIFDGFSTDADEVTDGLPDGSTDKSDDVWTERSFRGFLCFGKFCTGILIGIFTMNLAHGWMDGTDDGHNMDRWSSRWNHALVGRQTSHATDIWMDLS